MSESSFKEVIVFFLINSMHNSFGRGDTESYRGGTNNHQEWLKADQVLTLSEAWAAFWLGSLIPWVHIPSLTFVSYWQGAGGPVARVVGGFQLRSDECVERNTKMANQKVFILLIEQNFIKPKKAKFQYHFVCTITTFYQSISWIRPKLIKSVVSLNSSYFLKMANSDSGLWEMICFSPGHVYKAEQQKKMNTGLWTTGRNYFRHI